MHRSSPSLSWVKLRAIESPMAMQWGQRLQLERVLNLPTNFIESGFCVLLGCRRFSINFWVSLRGGLWIFAEFV